MKGPLTLDAPREQVLDEYRKLPNRASVEVERLDQVLLVLVSRLENYQEEKRLHGCRDWLYVITATINEITSSLAYARVLVGNEPHQRTYRITDGCSLSAAYFAENALLRLTSLTDKLAQFLNIWYELGRQEVRQVTFDAIQGELKAEAVFPYLQNVSRGLAGIREIRNAHTHRFDPDVARTEVQLTMVEYYGQMVPMRHYSQVNKPVSLFAEIDHSIRTYSILDSEIARVFEYLREHDCEVAGDAGTT